MTILHLKPQPAPTEWSGTGLVFVDPLIMMREELFPGDLVCLCINESNFPARVGLPNPDISGSEGIQIDVGIWHYIRSKLSSLLGVNTQPENIIEASSVLLNIKDD